MNLQRIVLGESACFIGDGVVHGVMLQPLWNDIAATVDLRRLPDPGAFPILLGAVAGAALYEESSAVLTP